MSTAFACPTCRSVLSAETCTTCGRAYELLDDVPVLLVGQSESAREQAAFFDDVEDVEFEIERPFGAPALYRWLLSEKFRRSVAGIALRGRTVLVVCGGSGMDAEFLARAGAEVIASDISLGAAKRAAERARRHGVSLTPIVADAERLPFADRSVDIVYVHDGLHHLDDPLSGLREMARVARCAVCVTEPADAFVTSLAVKAGVSLEREEAGNRVERLRLPEVREVLEVEGFRIVRATRYAMFYRHEPGAAMRTFSRPWLMPFARVGFKIANLLFGGVGNKLVVVAVRT